MACWLTPRSQARHRSRRLPARQRRPLTPQQSGHCTDMEAIKTTSWLLRTTGNVSIVVLSLVTFVLMLEGGLRVYSEFVFPKMMVIDEKLGWRHAADVSRTFVNEHGEKVLVSQNAFGHRGKHRATQNPSGLFRILALGDSFTEGVQVDENDVFTNQLELADPHLEVLNAGVG